MSKRKERCLRCSVVIEWYRVSEFQRGYRCKKCKLNYEGEDDQFLVVYGEDDIGVNSGFIVPRGCLCILSSNEV